MSWIALVGAIVVLLAADLLIFRGEMSTRRAAVASVAWVLVSLAFFGVVLATGDSADATAYLAGYLVEKSLSLDNVFVFLLVFTSFGVAAAERHRLLTYGIVGALALRLVFIVAGAALLTAFGWVSLIFAALLLWTAWRMFRHRHDHGGEAQLVEKVRGKLPAAGAALIAIAIV